MSLRHSARQCHLGDLLLQSSSFLLTLLTPAVLIAQASIHLNLVCAHWLLLEGHVTRLSHRPGNDRARLTSFLGRILTKTTTKGHVEIPDWLVS